MRFLRAYETETLRCSFMQSKLELQMMMEINPFMKLLLVEFLIWRITPNEVGFDNINKSFEQETYIKTC